MPLVGAAILPHGSMVLDKSRPELPAGTAEIHDMSMRTAQRVRAMQPDIIILHTPHSICLSNSLGVYLNPSAAGNAKWMGAWEKFAVAVRLANEEAKSLLVHLQQAEVAAEGIIAFANFDIPMRWSEVIPLWFITQALGGDIGPRDETVGAPAEPPPGQPRIILLTEGCGGGTGASSADRAAVSPGKIPETLRTGAEIRNWANQQTQRIVFLGSVDLAHGHGNSRCPQLPDGSGPDPRYRKPRYEEPLHGAEPFDEAMQCVIPPEFTRYAPSPRTRLRCPRTAMRISLVVRWRPVAIVFA